MVPPRGGGGEEETTGAAGVDGGGALCAGAFELAPVGAATPIIVARAFATRRGPPGPVPSGEVIVAGGGGSTSLGVGFADSTGSPSDTPSNVPLRPC